MNKRVNSASSAVASRKAMNRLSIGDRIDLWLGFVGPFGIGNRVEFYRDLAAFTAERLSPMAAVGKMHEVAKKRRSLKWLKLVTEHLIRTSKEGYASFGEQLSGLIDPGEAVMLSTGERGGAFPATLERLIALNERKAAISAAIGFAVLTVVVYGAVVLGLMFFVAKLLAPKYLAMVTPTTMAKLSFAPAYLATCAAVADWWLPALLILVGIVMAMVASLRRWRPGVLRSFLDDHVAPWSVYRRMRAALFLSTLSTALNSGGQFKSTLEVVKRASGPWERDQMNRMLTRLSGNGGIASAMTAGFLPQDVMDRLSIYLSVNGFEQILQPISNNAMDGLLKTARMVGRITKVVCTILIIAILLATVGAGAEIALVGLPTPGAPM